MKGEEIPVAFFSRQLRGAERHYSITELQSLAVVSVICHFESYLYGRKFTVVKDNKSCLALMTGNHLNKRLRRFALKWQEFDVELTYRPGDAHANADGLSRR